MKKFNKISISILAAIMAFSCSAALTANAEEIIDNAPAVNDERAITSYIYWNFVGADTSPWFYIPTTTTYTIRFSTNGSTTIYIWLDDGTLDAYVDAPGVPYTLTTTRLLHAGWHQMTTSNPNVSGFVEIL